MNLIFDEKAVKNENIRKLVEGFLKDIPTLEGTGNSPIVICQDGKSKGYYIKCSILAGHVSPLLDMNAKLNPSDAESFRANRELLTEHNTYKRMVSDAKEGREFNDIIVEFTKEYAPDKPLKIWGGQHRAKAIQQAYEEGKISRYHGFRIFFGLTKAQRTEIALVSNTNIAVSNDLFDRLQEETLVGLKLRDWCWKSGLLKKPEDFPDQGSRAERVTVKLARTFITNFFQGKERGEAMKADQLDSNIYEPHLCESGVALDSEYETIVTKQGPSLWDNKPLLDAGKAFAELHRSQFEAVKDSKSVENRKGFRNKALTESVISAWAYVAGLLQADPARLAVHITIPKIAKGVEDPLNAVEMSTYHHDSDDPPTVVWALGQL